MKSKGIVEYMFRRLCVYGNNGKKDVSTIGQIFCCEGAKVFSMTQMGYFWKLFL